jgi:hypothetical protein
MRLRGPWFRFLLLVLAVAASYACLKWSFPPYLWLAGIWISLSAFLFTTTTAWRRVAWFNAGAVLLALAAGEYYCWRGAPTGALRTLSTPGSIVSHEYLGNAPLKGAVQTVTRHDQGELSFRVDYTIDSLGWRVTPWPGAPREDASDVAFFGCSLTFGEGVPDSATLPAQASLRSGGRIRAHNFGFSGYGPHQMLAILEHRLEAPALPKAPALAVYMVIPSHIYRVLGRTTWDPGPRYRLEADGRVSFAGRFHSPLAARALNVLYRSFLVSRVLDAWNGRLTSRDYDLYFAVVAAARREFQARYAGSEFMVIYWDTRTRSPEALRVDERMLAGFASRGIRAVPVSRILPGYPLEARRYLLSPHDPHPNALAYRELAEYLIADVLAARSTLGDSALLPRSTGSDADPRAPRKP